MQHIDAPDLVKHRECVLAGVFLHRVEFGFVVSIPRFEVVEHRLNLLQYTLQLGIAVGWRQGAGKHLQDSRETPALVVVTLRPEPALEMPQQSLDECFDCCYEAMAVAPFARTATKRPSRRIIATHHRRTAIATET